MHQAQMGLSWDKLNQGEVVTLLVRLDDSSWYSVRDQTGREGWINASLLTIDSVVASNVPVESPAAAAARAVPTPAPTESQAPEPPRQAIPGLVAADVTVNLEQRQFTCSGPDQGASYNIWTCNRNEGTFEYIVEIYAKGLQVDYLNAAALQYDVPSDEIAAPLLEFMATMPFVAGSSSDAQSARSWVEGTLPTLRGQGDVRTNTFGGVPFELFGIPSARSLRMGTPSE